MTLTVVLTTLTLPLDQHMKNDHLPNFKTVVTL